MDALYNPSIQWWLLWYGEYISIVDVHHTRSHEPGVMEELVYDPLVEM
jgi:hypothetical protein